MELEFLNDKEKFPIMSRWLESKEDDVDKFFGSLTKEEELQAIKEYEIVGKELAKELIDILKNALDEIFQGLEIATNEANDKEETDK